MNKLCTTVADQDRPIPRYIFRSIDVFFFVPRWVALGYANGTSYPLLLIPQAEPYKSQLVTKSLIAVANFTPHREDIHFGALIISAPTVKALRQRRVWGSGGLLLLCRLINNLVQDRAMHKTID